MAIDRPIQSLDIYDLLTDLIPGAVVLGFVYLLFPIEDTALMETTGVFAFIVIIVSFVFGHVVQWLRGYFFKQPKAFQETMSVVRGEESSSRALEVNAIHETFEREVDGAFDLRDEDVGDTERFKLVLSYLETRPPVRAIKFQTLYSFHRSMVVASTLGVVLSITALTLARIGFDSTRHPYILLVALLFGVTLVIVSRSRRDKFEKEFVGYAIREFYQDRLSE